MEKICLDLFRKGFSTPSKKLDGPKSRHKALAPPNKMSAQYFQSFCLIISTLFDTEDMSTTFRHSCIHGNVHVVDILTELFDDEIKNSKLIGLRKACQTNKVAIVERLLHIQHDVIDTLSYASENGHLEIVEKLLQDDRLNKLYQIQFEESEELYDKCLFDACGNGHLAIVDLLLKDGRFNPAWNNGYTMSQTPLSEACSGGHITVVERLLQDSRVDPSYKHNFAISRMCFECHSTSAKIEIMKLLIENDTVDLLETDDDYEFNVLSATFISEDIEVARWLFNEFYFAEEAIDEATDTAYKEKWVTNSENFEASMLQIRALYDES